MSSGSQRQDGFALTLLGVVADLEADAFAYALHGAVFGEDVADDAIELFVAANFHEGLEQFRPQAEVLPLIVDEQGEFSVVGAANFAQAAHDAEFALLINDQWQH